MVEKNFFDEWSIYDHILEHNYMHHDEIYRDVARFLAGRFGDRAFAVLDLGCGSARHLARALRGRTVSRYVGYDLSEVALAHAKENLVFLTCPVELFCGDLREGLASRSDEFDVILASFALHHLTSAEKEFYFQRARGRLGKGGLSLVIDTMRDEGEDRPVYLDRYCAWLRAACKTLSTPELDLLCAHIRNCDFPETAAALGEMARRGGFGAGEQLTRIRWHHTWCFDPVAPAGSFG